MKGYRTILLGALMVMAPPLFNYLAGIHWGDYVSADTAFMISGVIAIALRVVTTGPIGKSVIAFFLVASAAMLALTGSPARAGDISGPAAINKALTAPVAPCQLATATTPLSCSGFYVGGGIGGVGSNIDIVGNGINGSVFAGGATPVFDFGYQYVQGNWMFGAEAILGYQLNSTTTVNGAGSNVNGLRAFELFKVGGNLSALFGTQAPITIPPQLANALIMPYAVIGPAQHQLAGAWANGLSSGAGAMFDIGPRAFIDLKYLYTNYNNAKSGAVTLPNDNLLLMTFNYKLN